MLRVLATWSPTDVPSIDDAGMRAALGGLPGTQMDAPFALRWDPRDRFSAEHEADLGWVGEDARGVWLARHPQTCLLEDEDLWGIWAEWSMTTAHEISLDEYARRSAWWTTAWLTMIGAANREDLRRGRTPPPSEGANE